MFPRIFSFLRKLIGLGRKLFDHIDDHDELLKIGIFRLVWRSREEELGNYIELLVRMPDIELLLACESDTQVVGNSIPLSVFFIRIRRLSSIIVVTKYYYDIDFYIDDDY